MGLLFLGLADLTLDSGLNGRILNIGDCLLGEYKAGFVGTDAHDYNIILNFSWMSLLLGV